MPRRRRYGRSPQASNIAHAQGKDILGRGLPRILPLH
jgi:hypothetical protein